MLTAVSAAAETARSVPEIPVGALAELARIARRDTALAEERRRLTDEAVAAITLAGLPRHFVPRARGGNAGTFAALVKAVAELGQACASVAWCAALFAAHGRLAAYLPARGQEEVWAEGPDARIAASVVPPQGTAVAHEAGWRLAGTWRLASGVDHADWVLLSSWTPSGEGREQRIFAVPRSDVRVLDTWHAVGMRGTGSNTVMADAVAVPAYRSFTLDSLLQQQPDAARCHAVPYPMVAALMFAAPVLGMARGALRAWTEERIGVPVRGAVAARLAEASAQIHSAGLLLEHAADRADRGEVTALAATENPRDSAMAAALCREAVDGLFRASGVRGQSPDSLVQRAWRDTTTAAGHGALAFDAAAEAYATAVVSPRSTERP